MVCKTKDTINLDQELKSVKIQDYPKVRDTPTGWPPLFGLTGDTWYERAKQYELKYGEKVAPLQKGKNNG